MKLAKFDNIKISELIDQTSWANDLSWSHIEQLSLYFRPYKAKKGELLLEEGEIGNFMGLIVEGEIEIIKESNGRQRQLAVLQPSHTFGELSLIDGEKCSASARVSKDALILITNKERLIHMSEHRPELGFHILWKISDLLSRRLRKTSGDLIDYL